MRSIHSVFSICMYTRITYVGRWGIMRSIHSVFSIKIYIISGEWSAFSSHAAAHTCIAAARIDFCIYCCCCYDLLVWKLLVLCLLLGWCRVVNDVLLGDSRQTDTPCCFDHTLPHCFCAMVCRIWLTSGPNVTIFEVVFNSWQAKSSLSCCLWWGLKLRLPETYTTWPAVAHA